MVCTKRSGCRTALRNGTACFEGHMPGLISLNSLWAEMQSRAVYKDLSQEGGLECELWELQMAGGKFSTCVTKDGLPVVVTIKRQGILDPVEDKKILFNDVTSGRQSG